MSDQRLDVWIPEDLKTYLADRAKAEERGMNQIVADLIRHERARQQGEIIEQQALPVVRDIVNSELRKALAQHRADVREDMQTDLIHEIKGFHRASDNRLAGLIVRTIRDSNIARRLGFAMLARSFGTDFAMHAYEDAREKAGKDLARKDDIEL